MGAPWPSRCARSPWHRPSNGCCNRWWRSGTTCGGFPVWRPVRRWPSPTCNSAGTEPPGGLAPGSPGQDAVAAAALDSLAGLSEAGLDADASLFEPESVVVPVSDLVSDLDESDPFDDVFSELDRLSCARASVL